MSGQHMDEKKIENGYSITFMRTLYIQSCSNEKQPLNLTKALELSLKLKDQNKEGRYKDTNTSIPKSVRCK